MQLQALVQPNVYQSACSLLNLFKPQQLLTREFISKALPSSVDATGKSIRQQCTSYMALTATAYY